MDENLKDEKIPFDFDDEDKENPIGSLLRYNRQEKDLNLDEISQALKVRQDFLEAMEMGRFDLLPGGFYPAPAGRPAPPPRQIMHYSKPGRPGSLKIRGRRARRDGRIGHGRRGPGIPLSRNYFQ